MFRKTTKVEAEKYERRKPQVVNSLLKDLRFAPRKGAVVLIYRGIYIYRRLTKNSHQEWI